MANNEITAKVHELRELRRMADELATEIEAIQDVIKAHMTAAGTEELSGSDFKVTWKTCTSNRFDSTAFKKAQPDVYAAFMTTSVSRRFIVA